MTRLGKRARTALCLAVAVLSASAASARTERFRWTQSNASGVNNFKLYYGTSSGSYSSSLDAGVPAKDSTGAYFIDIVVADSQTIYAAVTAWSGGLESTRSNEVSRAGLSGTPPPPPPATGNAGVVGFALWNAQTDTVVDSNFTNGEAIPNNVRACAAIEIKTNAYLNTSAAGSLKKVFDGVNNGCTGSGVENSYPYAWETDDGTGSLTFACASSLSVPGNHTLTVTPYNGDNCSGLAGSPVTLSFTVSGPSTPPPSSGLGAPGQPQIVP